MLKNKKGFSLAELMTVVIIIGLLAGMTVPMYLRSVRKTRVSVNMPLIRALQDDIVNFYNLNGELPNTLWKLAIDRKEFDVVSNTKGVHKATNCTIELKQVSSKLTVVEDCGEGWQLQYPVQSVAIGYVPAPRIFKITSNQATNAGIAKSFGWDKKGNSTTEYVIK